MEAEKIDEKEEHGLWTSTLYPANPTVGEVGGSAIIFLFLFHNSINFIVTD